MRLASLWPPFRLLLFGLAFVQEAFGSVAEQPPAVFDHLTTADGLPQGTVLAILQDSQGFVWFGTEDGLVRYDGHRLVRYGYRQGAADTLPGSFIRAIAEDANHDLWIAVAESGLARWSRSTDRFTVFRRGAGGPGSLASDAVVALLIDDGGRVWVGTRDSGLDVLDPRTDKVVHFRHDPLRADSLIDDRIESLKRAPNGVIWVGTDGGVDRIGPGSQSFLHSPAVPGERKTSVEVLSLYIDPSGTVWQGVPDGGLIRRNSSGEITAHFRHVAGSAGSLANDNVHAVLQDSDGHLWVGTEAGLDMFDPTTEQFSHYRHQDGDRGSLTDSYIMSLYQDAHGLLWVGTSEGGVDRWNPRSWKFGSHRPKWLENRMVTAFADAGDDRIWLASMGGGLVRFDPRTDQQQNIDEIIGRHAALSDSRVTALELDATGTLWIGTLTAGVRSLSSGGRLRAFGSAPGSDRALSAPAVMSLFSARDGRIWIGTHGGGANVLDPSSGKVVQLPFESTNAGAVSSGSVTGFAEDPSGAMWIATEGGGLDLADSTGQVLRVFRHADQESTSLPSNTVYGVTVDPVGRVWAATSRGLARVLGSTARPDGIHFQSFGRAEGLAGDVVYGIVPDASGYLWISGNSGLTRYDPETGMFRTYHVQHGLQGEEFEQGAYRRLHSGQLAFGGPGGFNLFDPQSIKGSDAPPRVALVQVDVVGAPLQGSKPYWLLDRIHVDANARIITFGFAALDFTSPEHNRLAYRLPNFSDRWIDLGTEHDVTLTNLGAGVHVLEVRGASADSGWGSSPLRITIHKDPPFWASPPAELAYLTLALILAALAWRIRMRRRAQAEHIKRLAYYDPLTRLPNRQQCLDAAGEMISRAAATRDTVSFIYLDLNGFKRINDTFGHTVGDDVLCIVAQRLTQAISTQTAGNQIILSRFGGDEFVVLVNSPVPGLGLEIARACHSTLGAAIKYEPAEFFAIPSVGVAVYPEDGADAETVLKHADTAMYHAKSTGTGGVVVYSPAMSSRLRKAMRLESRLRRAIRAEALTVEFQPKFRLADQGLIGAEVLSRWHDDELGNVSPAEFIAIAEESSLIIELGEWVMRAACRQLRAWSDIDVSLPLAVNVSGKELLHGHPARTLEHEARAAGISPSLIEIEITESLLVRESAAVRTALDGLRNLGCLISLDDFGTGYSSLAYITRFPPDKIKIDKSFVQNVDHSVTDAAIVTAILSLGESLHLTTTAEGIERKTQLDWLRDRGCREGQGFLLSRPLSALRLKERFLESNTVRLPIPYTGS